MFRKLLLVAVSSVALPLLCAQTYRGSIGGEVEIGEGNRSRAFTDLAKTFRPFDSTPIDGNGWPAADFDMLFFDIRPVAAWFGTDRIDDPEKYIPDWSGTYKLSFQGQAAIAASSDPVTIANQQYDAASNTTTADVILPPGTATMSLKFTGTQRDAGGATNTGVTNLKLIRPGYPADGSQVFTDEFLASLQPYTHLRFMGVLDTNSADPKWDVNKSISGNQKKWSDRHLPSDATQQSYGNKHGIAWEYVIELANESNKDIWINIPVSADDDYVRQLARLMHDTLKPGIRIYIEHGNEVWNNSFTGNAWNYNAAQAEILAGGSNLNKPNASPDDIGQRRHLRRVAEIGQAFLDVYGHDALGTLIRPVYAGFILRTGQYSDTLDWFKTNIGVPAKYIYGVAQTHYYNDASARVAGKTIDDVLAAFRQDSDLGIQSTKAMQNVATAFGLKQLVYEGGADILRPERRVRCRVCADTRSLFLDRRLPRRAHQRHRHARHAGQLVQPRRRGLHLLHDQRRREPLRLLGCGRGCRGAEGRFAQAGRSSRTGGREAAGAVDQQRRECRQLHRADHAGGFRHHLRPESIRLDSG